VESLLRHRYHGRRLPCPARLDRLSQARSVLLMPRRLHEDPAEVGIAGLGDAPARLLLPTGILARDEPYEAHAGAGSGEAAVSGHPILSHRGRGYDSGGSPSPPAGRLRP